MSPLVLAVIIGFLSIVPPASQGHENEGPSESECRPFIEKALQGVNTLTDDDVPPSLQDEGEPGTSTEDQKQSIEDENEEGKSIENDEEEDKPKWGDEIQNNEDILDDKTKSNLEEIDNENNESQEEDMVEEKNENNEQPDEQEEPTIESEEHNLEQESVEETIDSDKNSHSEIIEELFNPPTEQEDDVETENLEETSKENVDEGKETQTGDIDESKEQKSEETAEVEQHSEDEEEIHSNDEEECNEGVCLQHEEQSEEVVEDVEEMKQSEEGEEIENVEESDDKQTDESLEQKESAEEEQNESVEEEKEPVEGDKEFVEEQNESIGEQNESVEREKKIIEEEEGKDEEDKESVEEQKESLEEDEESIEEQKNEEDKESVEEQKESVEEDKESIKEQKDEEDKESVEVQKESMEEDKESVEQKNEEHKESVEEQKDSVEEDNLIEVSKEEIKSNEEQIDEKISEEEVSDGKKLSDDEENDDKIESVEKIDETEQTADNEKLVQEKAEDENEDKIELNETDESVEDEIIKLNEPQIEPPEEEELTMVPEVPEKLRSRDHMTQILHLNAETEDTEKVLSKTVENTLKELKKLYEAAIKPLEILYKYRDLSNRHFGDPEIFSKPLILFMGPWSGGKSTIINYLLENEYKQTSLRTGADPSPAYFNIVMWGEEAEILDGTQLAADWTFSGLQKFGQVLLDRLRGLKLNHPLLQKVNIVEIPGILEIRKQVERLFPFNDACQWFIDRADIIFLVYDPSKLDIGPETEAILDQLKGREMQTRIILNKADQVKPEELMRVQGTLIWNISPLMSSSEPPVMYSTSLWSLPYEFGSPTRLLHAQEKAFLTDLRSAIDKRVENKIAGARRFAVRVRNHAKMVDCYLTTYYNHKSFFDNKKHVSDDIIEHPQNYHIYEGLSTLTNISRYDLPDPDVYRDFFRLNPIYEFQQLSATCTYFRGCPINRLDLAIAYDLPELVGKYKKSVEELLKSYNARK